MSLTYQTVLLLRHRPDLLETATKIVTFSAEVSLREVEGLPNICAPFKRETTDLCFRGWGVSMTLVVQFLKFFGKSSGNCVVQ